MNIQWDGKKYADDFNFVPQYGEAVLDLITLPKGSFAVDLGCGNGALTAKLAERGYNVLGIDDSAEMLELAGRQHSDIPFRKENALTFHLDQPADIIFSNAVFHWINAEDQQTMLNNVAGNIRIGGELVAEFGGYGCAASVHTTLARKFADRGLNYAFEFYFPTIGMYAPMLEAAGLRVEYAVLFDRPTPQKSNDGLAEWIRMFNIRPFESMDPDLKEMIIREAVADLYPVLYHDGHWFIDYVRIRIRARKI